MVPTLPGEMPMNMAARKEPLAMSQASSGRPACQKARAVWRASAITTLLTDQSYGIQLLSARV